MRYVVLLFVVAVVSVLLVMFSPAPMTFTVASSVPLLAGRSIETSLWLVVAGCALAGAFLTWLAGLNQAGRMTRRMKRLEGMVRSARESLAEKDETIARYEEQLISLGVMDRREPETPEAEDAEPTPETAGATEDETAQAEEGAQ